jgi:hypothetical protein
MGFNSAFKGLNCRPIMEREASMPCSQWLIVLYKAGHLSQGL